MNPVDKILSKQRGMYLTKKKKLGMLQFENDEENEKD